MNILVIFFNETTELVETRYFDSTFLERPNGTNLLQKLIESLSSLSHSNILQLLRDVSKQYYQYRMKKNIL